jgi:thiamine pyrophosphokinase
MANKQKCMIIGAVPIKSAQIFKTFNPDDYFVICADAGYETALKYHIRPDMIVGDFDSAKVRPPKELNVLTLPVKKDDTDTKYAAMRAITMGMNEVLLLCCLGGDRFDHSYANLEVLQYITSCNAMGIMADETTQITLLAGRKMRITESVGYTVSVFPFNGSTCNVSYKGLEYPLTRKTLTCGGSLMGVSNSVLEDPAEINVHSGTALIILYKP